MRRVSLLALAALLVGCDPRLTGDSTAPAYATAAVRVDWMKRRLGGRTPSAMRDAHFFATRVDRRGGAEGPAYASTYFWAKIVIDPADASRWAAATRAARPPAGGNPWTAARPYAMSDAEFRSAAWYDPAPLFGDYGRGRMAITRTGDAVFVFQTD